MANALVVYKDALLSHRPFIARLSTCACWPTIKNIRLKIRRRRDRHRSIPRLR